MTSLTKIARRLLSLAAAAGALAALATPGSAGSQWTAVDVSSRGAFAPAASRTATTVTIQAQEGGFFGYVKSKKQACENRNVTLYRQAGGTRNRARDVRVGSDLAQPNGPDSMWSIATDEAGKFYAYVKATKTCAEAYSKSVAAQAAAADAARALSAAIPTRTAWTIRPYPPAPLLWLTAPPSWHTISVRAPVAGDLSQHWILVRRTVNQRPAYEIRNRYSGWCLALMGGGFNWRQDGTAVTQLPCDKYWDTTTWVLYHPNSSRPQGFNGVQTNAGFQVRNLWSGKCLGAPNMTYAHGVEMRQYTCARGFKQLWRFTHFTTT